MFFIKIFHFVRGYVILSVKGNNKEEFLNELLKMDIKPRKMIFCDDSFFAELDLDDFFLLRHLPIRARIHVEERHGLAFLIERLKKRKAFLFGMLAFVLLFTVSSHFIWSVEYEGAENIDIGQLEAAAELAGLKPGVLKKNLKTPLEMKNIILNHTDGICWAWVYIRGTKAVVDIRQNIIPPEVFDPDVPCDIVAIRDGVVKRVITKRGKCLVENGETVVAGQTVVSGRYDFEEKGGYATHSKATLELHTVHVKRGTYTQNYCYKTYTGKKKSYFTLKFFKWEFPLYLKKNINSVSYDKNIKDFDAKIGRNNFIGIGLRRENYAEFQIIKEPISRETTEELAKRELEAQIAKELLPQSQKISEQLDVKEIDSETLQITLKMEFIEQAGTEREITEVTTIEPKTDRDTARD
ncbi:MAG: sporulation protein YqfD [Firmicutes bacterium]|nr:sporulation protein YqfD [Bacillota bacterium]